MNAIYCASYTRWKWKLIHKRTKHFPDFALSTRTKERKWNYKSRSLEFWLQFGVCINNKRTSEARPTVKQLPSGLHINRELIALTAHIRSCDSGHCTCITIKNRLNVCDNKWKNVCCLCFRQVFQLTALFFPDNFLNSSHAKWKSSTKQTLFSQHFVIATQLTVFSCLIKKIKLVMSSIDSVGMFSKSQSWAQPHSTFPTIQQ